MNNWNGIGRLTRDPELRYIPGSGTAICNFTIAIDKGLSKDKKKEIESKGGQTADFIKISAWGKIGENAANYLKKGRLVGITGSIQTGSYEDKDGKRVYTTEINARNVEFLEWGNKEDNQNNAAGFIDTDMTDIPF